MKLVEERRPVRLKSTPGISIFFNLSQVSEFLYAKEINEALLHFENKIYNYENVS